MVTSQRKPFLFANISW